MKAERIPITPTRLTADYVDVSLAGLLSMTIQGLDHTDLLAFNLHFIDGRSEAYYFGPAAMTRVEEDERRLLLEEVIASNGTVPWAHADDAFKRSR